jgi:hypothetical protein
MGLHEFGHFVFPAAITTFQPQKSLQEYTGSASGKLSKAA